MKFPDITSKDGSSSSDFLNVFETSVCWVTSQGRGKFSADKFENNFEADEHAVIDDVEKQLENPNYGDIGDEALGQDGDDDPLEKMAKQIQSQELKLGLKACEANSKTRDEFLDLSAKLVECPDKSEDSYKITFVMWS